MDSAAAPGTCLPAAAPFINSLLPEEHVRFPRKPLTPGVSIAFRKQNHPANQFPASPLSRSRSHAQLTPKTHSRGKRIQVSTASLSWPLLHRSSPKPFFFYLSNKAIRAVAKVSIHADDSVTAPVLPTLNRTEPFAPDAVLDTRNGYGIRGFCWGSEAMVHMLCPRSAPDWAGPHTPARLRSKRTLTVRDQAANLRCSCSWSADGISIRVALERGFEKHATIGASLNIPPPKMQGYWFTMVPAALT